MKRILPKTVKIAGFDYKVVFPHVFDPSSSFLGILDAPQLEMRIAEYTQLGDKRPPEAIMETFFHENFHGIEHNYLCESISHDDLNILAKAWFHIFRYNRIFTIKGIPKKVNIGGFTYQVLYPFKFIDDPNQITGATYHNSLKIKLRGFTEDGQKVKVELVKKELIFYIFMALRSFYILNSFAEDDGEDKMRIIASGWYQVAKDNNFEELVKKSVKGV